MFTIYKENKVNTVQSDSEALLKNLNQCYFKLWGTRGSTCVSGPEYNNFGGNTACLEIRNKDSLIIIDSGTGIRKLGNEILVDNIHEFHLIIGHFHWDHILGFPFFLPLYSNKYTIHIHAPGPSAQFIKQQFEILLRHEFFPVSLEEMKANVIYHCLDVNNPIQNGDIIVENCLAHHPGTTYCFKITTANTSIGYATDNEFLLGYDGPIKNLTIENPIFDPYRHQINFFNNCDIMIHEAQYIPKDYHKKIHWGHSSTSNAAALIQLIKPKEWIITHHDPEDTDKDLLRKKEIIKAALNDANISCPFQIAEDEFYRTLGT